MRKIASVLFLGMWISQPVFAAETEALTEMSLEELMNVEVTSVSKTPQQYFKIPAAVFVLTNEDIRRSGATTIPDVLRLVPGVDVASIDGNKWAVSIRGFNERFANKLLVLIDGRSVYDPLFSGTHWDVQDTLFEDIDRIEVIRGPGGTVWGANAVNGVINIITKSAKETHGGYVSAGGGDPETAFGEFRYGAQAGNLHWRVYTKEFKRNASFEGADDWSFKRAGFRTDWEIQDKDTLTVQGDLDQGESGTTLTRYSTTLPLSQDQTVDEDVDGGNFLARFSHVFAPKSDFQIQTYYDHSFRDSIILDERRDAFDLDTRFRFPAGNIQEIILGLGYRTTADATHGSFEARFDPPNRRDDIYSGSIQDDIRLFKDLFTVTLGSKFEHNDYTGFEYQPSGRVAFYPDSRNTVWGSITRAVRTPSRADTNSITQFPVLPLIFPTVTLNRGSEDFKSEILVAYEAGYRAQVRQEVTLDLAAFYNEYDNLRTSELGNVIVGASSVTQLVTLQNQMEAKTYGGELSLRYQVMERWRLAASYSYLHMRLTPDPTSTSVNAQGPESESPAHTLALWSQADLPGNLELDAAIRYVDSLMDVHAPGYWVSDLRLAWKPKKDLEISIVGRNLLDAKHFEFMLPSFEETFGHPQRIRPSVYGKISYKF